VGDIKRPSKWITDVDGSAPIADAARHIVDTRTTGLSALLDLAASAHEEDIEHIHRLRVTTRRADAALAAFAPCFGPRRHKHMRKMLKRIRNAAGDARTCDVHLILLNALRDQTASADRKALRYAVKRLEQERADAQHAVNEAAERYPADKIERRIAKLHKSARAPRPADFDIADAANGLNFHDAGVISLARTIRDVRETASGDLTVLEHAHALRLKFKRLRYSIELFAGCFDASLRADLYPRISGLQDILGELNDAHEIMLRFERYADSVGDDDRKSNGNLALSLTRLAEGAKTERDRQHQKFLKWWRKPEAEELLPLISAAIDDAPPQGE
jgi:CHAD domain-containing protein